MSQKDIYQPGAKLKRVLDLTAELKRRIVALVESPNPNYEEFEKFVEETSTKIGIDPDGYKYIYDKLNAEADRFQTSADHYAELALILSGTAEAIEMQLRNYMESHNLTKISGETWDYELTTMEPAINIAKDKLDLEYLVQIFVPDEHKIKSHAAMGKDIKGVSVTHRKNMKKTVIKKVPTNA